MSKSKMLGALCMLILLAAVALFPKAANIQSFVGGNLNSPSSRIDDSAILQADGGDPQPRPIPIPKPPAKNAA